MADEYIAFLQSLEGKLDSLKTEREAILAEIAEYEKYESALIDVQSSKSGGVFETLVDIGEGCFVQGQANRSDIPKAFIHIGLGIHVQFSSTQEIHEFIDRRKDLLRQQSDWRYSKIGMMQADINQMKQMLQQLQSIG